MRYPTLVKRTEDGRWLVSSNARRHWHEWKHPRLLYRCPDCSETHVVDPETIPVELEAALPHGSKLVADHGQRAEAAILGRRS